MAHLARQITADDNVPDIPPTGLHSGSPKNRPWRLRRLTKDIYIFLVVEKLKVVWQYVVVGL